MRGLLIITPARSAGFGTAFLGLLSAGACALALAVPGTAMAADGGRRSGPAVAAPRLATHAPGIPVKPKEKVFLSAWVEYNINDCTLISSGRWNINKAPKYGKTSTDILTGTLNNGDCPGVQFPFAALYYKWPGGEGAGMTDKLTATWKAPDFVQQQSFELDLVRAVPVNFTQVGAGEARPHGVLHFNYAWESSSGNLADIADCEIGEYVTYPGGDDPYVWPSPPFNSSTPNPTILWVPGQDGSAQDNHSHGPFLQPYEQAGFNARQKYRYRCPAPVGTVDFEGFTKIRIARAVLDRTGKGCWDYHIAKSGASASEKPMPGVKDKACAKEKTPPGPANSAAELGLSAATVAAGFGLHEPVLVDLTVANLSGRDARADLGLNRTANLVIAVRTPWGQVETARLSDAGFGRSGEIKLAPGAAAGQLLLLNEWYGFPRAGTYRVSITLAGEGPDRPHTDVIVNILPRDAGRIQHLAGELAAKALDADSAQDRMDAARALSHMADPAAVASLVQVLQHGPTLERYAIAGLERIRSPEAISALMQAANSHPDAQVRAAARSALKLIDGSTHSAPEPLD